MRLQAAVLCDRCRLDRGRRCAQYSRCGVVVTSFKYRQHDPHLLNGRSVLAPGEKCASNRESILSTLATKL